ncbi:glycosyltransferase family 2 protein [Flagellatimonas centrodinii]|uniref:glycosyltransferase family 2 protein n=1 Tax=Flagellatimonas centrodinii TaxID=2806210 RepID=UPI001FEF0B8F|nr:glycosyltransferase family 2 protein [Flagellatimonas centrodinii]ULQ46831.1 glycosyltransferase family 2 protein [Flagellatimonas centrodinii]
MVTPELSIIVPVFNEAETLRPFWQRLCRVLDDLDTVAEVLFVDDGSRDASAAVLATLASTDPRIGRLLLSRNFGKEVAMSAGLDHVSGRWTVIIDADLQDPPELIPRLLETARGGYDMVYARRTHRHGESWLKRASAAAFYRVIGRLSHRVEVPRDTGDFRVLSARAVVALRQLRERHRFMKGLFAWIGYPSTEVTYARDPRAAGASHFGFWRLWNFALDGITSFSTAPLKLATYLGFLVALGAFAFGLWIILKTMMFGEAVAGYPTIMVTLLFFSGMQLMFIGVIGEYLARMFDETKQRPLYLVQAYDPAALPAQPEVQPADQAANTASTSGAKASPTVLAP